MLAAALLGSACAAGGQTSGQSVTPAQLPASAAAARRPGPAQAAPDLAEGLRRVQAATDLDGAVVGPAPADKQVTAVVVFASWCGVCRHELAILGELLTEEPRLRVIGVNAYEEYADFSDEQRLRAFVAETAPWLQVVRADAALFAALGRPTKIPSMFLFDRDGAVVETYLRVRRRPPDKAELAAAIARALP